jgi:DNA-binding response OmpR family regulator
MGIDAQIALVQSDPLAALSTLDRLWRFEAGCRVIWCEDGLAGLEYVFGTGRHWDRPEDRLRLVLIDVGVRVVDGLEVLRRIRGSRDVAPVKVAMMSRRVPSSMAPDAPHVDRWMHIPPSEHELAGALRLAGLGAVLVEGD